MKNNDDNIQKALWLIECILSSLEMIGQCEQCGLTNVEVKPKKIENNSKTRTLCNQCRPADGAYAY